MIHKRKYPVAALLFLLLPVAHAGGACSYGEAIMAFERGNTVRGMALMKMAARDGDERARQYLAQRMKPSDQTLTLAKPQEIARR